MLGCDNKGTVDWVLNIDECLLTQVYGRSLCKRAMNSLLSKGTALNHHWTFERPCFSYR